jgi:Replication-relaxation
METEQIAPVTRRVIPPSPGRLTISMERDIPLLELVRDCTYITRSQIEELGSWQESYRNRNRRLNRLVEIQHLTTHGQTLPYKGMVYSIGRAGLATLEVIGNGLLNVTSESESLSKDLQIPHYLGINKSRVRMLEAFKVRSWWSDRVLQSLNIMSNSPTIKDYDAIVEIDLSTDRPIKVGFEYERTLKSKERYADIRRLLDREESVSGVLYVAEGEQAAVALSGLVYSLRCPVATTTTSQLEAHGADAEVRRVSGSKVVRSKLNSFLFSLK